METRTVTPPHRFVLRIPIDVLGRLRQCAKQQDRSLNKMIIIALKFYLDSWEYYNK
jgi:predicted HicB family RNase H-like nuclease